MHQILTITITIIPQRRARLSVFPLPAAVAPSCPAAIVVDDTDAAIQYSPPSAWFAANVGTLNAQGNFGPVYRNTSHSTTTDGATMRFAFNGTSVAVSGSIAVTKLADGTYDPSWECDVDGIKIGESNPTFAFAENNWSLCNQDVISPGAHMLTVTVHSKGGRGGCGWCSGGVYEPGCECELWTGWQGWGYWKGTEVSLLGYMPQELAHNATSGTYSIDGAPAHTIPHCRPPIHDQHHPVQPPHNLVVTYEGDRNHAPLPVGVFYVTNAAATTPSESSSSVHWGTASPSSTSTPTAAIAGGTIGCIALLAVIIGAVFWCRHRRRRSRPKEEKETQSHPFGPANSSVVGTLGSESILPPFAPSQLYKQQQQQNPFNTPVSTPSASAGHGHGQGYPYSYGPPISASGGSNLHSHSQAHSASPSLSLSAVSASASSPSPSSAGVAGLGLPTTPSLAALPLPPLPGKLEPHRMPRVVLQQHQDSGVRMRTGGPQTVVVEELPPGYSRD
ncbi:hypothetical protein C8F01DRAFT_1144346 [Mycena amicta]|nr:hypothetical protein C8F01DRAFT_1144346 [Mycena amicta]